MMVPTLPYLARPPGTIPPPPPGFPTDFYGFCLPRAQLVMEECLAAALYICNNELAEFGICEIFDVVSQIMPTAFALNTGMWIFYRRVDGVSMCSCGRFAIPCRHTVRSSASHCVDLSNFPTSPPAARFQVKTFGQIVPKDYRLQILNAVGDYSPIEMRIDLLLEHVPFDNEMKTLPAPFAYTLQLRCNFVSQLYPHLLSIVMDPNPVLLDCYSKFFSKLNSRFRSRNSRCTSYSINYTQVPDFTLTMMVINMPPPVIQSFVCARLYRDPIYDPVPIQPARCCPPESIDTITSSACPHYLKERGPWKVTAPELRELLEGNMSRAVIATTTMPLQSQAMASMVETATSKLLADNPIARSLRSFKNSNPLREDEEERMLENIKRSSRRDARRTNISEQDKASAEGNISFADVVRQPQYDGTPTSTGSSFLHKNSGGTMTFSNSDSQALLETQPPSMPLPQFWTNSSMPKRPEKFVGYSQQFPALRKVPNVAATEVSQQKLLNAKLPAMSTPTTVALDDSDDPDYNSKEFSELIAAIRRQINLDQSTSGLPREEVQVKQDLPSSCMPSEILNQRLDPTQCTMKPTQLQRPGTIYTASASTTRGGEEPTQQRIMKNQVASLLQSIAFPQSSQSEAVSNILPRTHSEIHSIHTEATAPGKETTPVVPIKPTSDINFEKLRSPKHELQPVDDRILSPNAPTLRSSLSQPSTVQVDNVEGTYSYERKHKLGQLYQSQYQSMDPLNASQNMVNSWTDKRQTPKTEDMPSTTLCQSENVPLSSHLSVQVSKSQPANNSDTTVLPSANRAETQTRDYSMTARQRFLSSLGIRELLQSPSQSSPTVVWTHPLAQHLKPSATLSDNNSSPSLTVQNNDQFQQSGQHVPPFGPNPIYVSAYTGVQIPVTTQSMQPPIQNFAGPSLTIPRSLSYGDVCQNKRVDTPSSYQQYPEIKKSLSTNPAFSPRLPDSRAPIKTETPTTPVKLPSYNEAFPLSKFSFKNQPSTFCHLHKHLEGLPTQQYLQKIQSLQRNLPSPSGNGNASSSLCGVDYNQTGEEQLPDVSTADESDTLKQTEDPKGKKGSKSSRGGRGGRRGRKLQNPKRKSCDKLVKVVSKRRCRKSSTPAALPFDESTQFPSASEKVQSPITSYLSFQNYFQNLNTSVLAGLTIDEQFEVVEGVIEDNMRRELIEKGVEVPEGFDWKEYLKQSKVEPAEKLV